MSNQQHITSRKGMGADSTITSQADTTTRITTGVRLHTEVEQASKTRTNLDLDTYQLCERTGLQTNIAKALTLLGGSALCGLTNSLLSTPYTKEALGIGIGLGLASALYTATSFFISAALKSELKTSNLTNNIKALSIELSYKASCTMGLIGLASSFICAFVSSQTLNIPELRTAAFVVAATGGAEILNAYRLKRKLRNQLSIF